MIPKYLITTGEIAYWPSNEKQCLLVTLDRKQRNGKEVTVVSRFEGEEEDLNLLCRELKTGLGTGGSVKEGEILIQGDLRKRVHVILLNKGYLRTKLR